MEDKISFYSYPAFTKSYSFDFYPESDQLDFRLDESISLADSLTPTSLKFMDSSRVEKIKKFVPLSNKFRIKISDKNNSKLKSILKSLSNCNEDKFMPGIDGTTYTIVKTENGKEKICKYWSPEMTKYGSEIGDVLDILLEELKDYPIALRAVENSGFRESHNWRVLSSNPTYMRIIKFEEDCKDFEKFMKKLPSNNDEIYLDISNYKISYGGKCITELLRKKYKHIYWITDGFPDEKNEIIDGK